MTNFTIGQKVRITHDSQYEGKIGTFNGIPDTFTGNISDESPCKVKLDNGKEIDTFFFNLELVNERNEHKIQIGSKICVINGMFKGHLGKVRMSTSDNNLFFLVDLLDNISVEISDLDMVAIVGSTIFTK